MCCRTNVFIIYDLHSLLESNQKIQAKNEASNKERVKKKYKIARLYMDGWRDGLNRLWRDGVTILPRPAKKIATAKNNRPVPALEKKKNTAPSRPFGKKKPPRPASEKKKNAPSRLGKKKQQPRPASKKKKNAPSRHEQQNTPPRGWKLETNTTACLFFSLSCCTFISYCTVV